MIDNESKEAIDKRMHDRKNAIFDEGFDCMHIERIARLEGSSTNAITLIRRRCP